MKITAFCLFSKTWISLLSLLRRRLQLNQLPTLKGLRHEYIPKLSVLISRFSQLWKNREIEDPRINIPARFKQAKLNTHTQNCNHRKKKMEQLQYILHKYRKIIGRLTGTFHSLTVPSVVK